MRFAARAELTWQPCRVTVRGQLGHCLGDLAVAAVDRMAVPARGGRHGVPESLHLVGRCGSGLCNEGPTERLGNPRVGAPPAHDGHVETRPEVLEHRR